MDRVIETEDGFDCLVDGRRFGTWRSRALAKAGMEVEQGRAAKKRYLTQEQWDNLVSDLCAVS